MNEFDPAVIYTLRKMANDHCSVADMVRAVLPGRPPAIQGTFDVVRYFGEAFGLTLPQAKPIADWLGYGGDEQPEVVAQK